MKTRRRTILLIAIALAAGCSDDATRPDAPSSRATAPLRMLALGDSYTAGEGVSWAQSWPAQLDAALSGAGIALDGLQVVARTGWTTRDLIDTTAALPLEPPATVVTVLIGVNNQFAGMPVEEYAAGFDSVLAAAVTLAGGVPAAVLVISLPDYGATPLGALFGAEEIAREIDAYNVANRRLAREAGAGYVDITAISRRAREERGLVARDGLHPSGKMYALWVEEILPAAVEVISTRRGLRPPR